MIWTQPTFDTIKMDAEIGSYQEDRERDDRLPSTWTAHAEARFPRLARPSSTRTVADGARSSR
jgi:hypothetical protein